MTRAKADDGAATQVLRIIVAAAGAGISLTAGGVLGLTAFTAAALLLLLLRPVFSAYALARPNARSSHRVPTPQGGGLPLALTVVAGIMWLLASGRLPSGWLPLAVVCATLMLAVLGAIDDMRPLPVRPRLLVQSLAVAAVVTAAPAEWRLLPGVGVPLAIERALLILGGLWLVNLTNFMDGIDGITVAGFVPMALVVHLVTTGSGTATLAGHVALLLAAGLLAFLPFNWPPARLFLGDVGSLPVGLLAGFLLFDLACRGHLAAAIMLPLYHVADATLTLLGRWRRGERLSEAHRLHAYQRAVDRGVPALVVSGAVAGLNIVLAALATLAIVLQRPVVDAFALGLAALAVGMLIRWLGGRSRAH